MKLQVTAGVCILAAIVAAGAWDLQRSSAQVAATSASAPAPTPLQRATADVFIATPGSPVPPPADVPVLSPTKPRVFHYGEGFDPELNAVYGGGKTVHLKSKPGNRQAADALRQAAAALRDAKDDAAKTAAQGQLTELLDKVFEDDMQRREEELAQVEQRTKDLRALLGRRREKKNEIVELQIKVLLNEADGLGFFNESPMPAKAFYWSDFKAVSGDAGNTVPRVDLFPGQSPTTTPPAAGLPAR